MPSLETYNMNTEVRPAEFYCRTSRAQVVSSLLSTIHSGKTQTASAIISPTGIKMTVDGCDGRSASSVRSSNYQANAFLQSDLFDVFTLADHIKEPIRFQLPLHTFIECLNIFGGSSSPISTELKIMYSGYGTPLTLSLIENEAVTEVEMELSDYEDMPSFSFRSTTVVNKVIMEPGMLRESFNELDWSCKHLTMLLSPDAPFFRLSTLAEGGSCQIDYPQDNETFESFDCNQTQTNLYLMKLMQPAVKALSVAHKCQIRMSREGLLNIQLMIRGETGLVSFVDFFVVASQSDEYCSDLDDD